MVKQETLDSFSVSNEQVNNGLYPLPKEWRWVKLKDVVSRVQYGLSKAMNTENAGYPIIRMNNITFDGKLTFSDLKYADVDKKTADKYRLKVGDILFNRTNSRDLVGKTAIFRQKGNYLFVSYIIRVEVDDSKTIPEYICSYLNSGIGKRVLFNTARQAIQMANINAKELCNIDIPLAPLDEQKRIVTRLEELLSRIEKAKKTRKNSEVETSNIFQSALNIVFSKAEEKGWRLLDLRKVTSQIKSGFACSKKHEVKNGNGIPHLRPNNIGYYGELELSKIVKIPKEMVDLETYSLRKGDVLFNNTNSKELVGRAIVISENLDYGFSNHITRIRVNPNIATPEWLVHSLNYLWLQKHFLKICRKWIGQAGINQKMLKSVKIYTPSLEEQEKIGIYLEKIHLKLNSLEQNFEESDKILERITPAILDIAFKGRLV